MRKFAAFLLIISLTSQSLACTTFNFTDNGMSVVGKSYDWGLGHGMIAANKRHVAKTSVVASAADQPMQWTSAYSSVTFSQFGVEFPLGGINEQGLNVEIMWLASSRYPTAAEDNRPAVNELQWIQYILDTSANSSEAVANAQKVRVSPLLAKVHYLVCDRDSQCATFEYINKKLVIHTGVNMTLTNNTVAESMKYLKSFDGFGGIEALPIGETHSLDRFVLASAGVKNFKSQMSTPDYAMSVLQSVYHKGSSQWHIVYEQSTGIIYFRTAAETAIKKFNFKQFNPSCKTAVQVLDMNSGLPAGDISSRFKSFSTAFNNQMIEENTFLTQNLIDLAENYPASTRCLE